MEGDECMHVGGGVARRAAYNAGRAANREARERGTYASTPQTQPREARTVAVVTTRPKPSSWMIAVLTIGHV